MFLALFESTGVLDRGKTVCEVGTTSLLQYFYSPSQWRGNLSFRIDPLRRPSLCVSSIRLYSCAAKMRSVAQRTRIARPESGGGIRSYLRGVPNAAAVCAFP